MTDYPSNITDNQWNSIENYFDPDKRKRKHPLIEIMNAILYTLVSGCQWRMLPKDFPPYNTVYYYFRKWKYEGSFEQAMFELHQTVRVAAGREESPSLGIIDSRSNRTSNHVDTDKGLDGNKKVKGRKIHICVDILGLPLAIVIHAANIADSVGAELVFNEMVDRFPRLKANLPTADIEVNLWQIAPKNMAGNSMWSSVRTNVQRNSLSCPSVGLSKGLSLGLRNAGD